MPEPLTIAAAQPPCLPYDVVANALTHAAVIRSAAARVMVFPELSITGYELDAEAIDADDPRLAPVVAACAETATLALLGAPAAGSGGRSHIAMLAGSAGRAGDGSAPAYGANQGVASQRCSVWKLARGWPFAFRSPASKRLAKASWRQW